MTIENLEDLVMKLRTDDSLRVKDQQYFQENAVDLFIMYVMIPYMIAYNKLTAE